MGKGLHFFIALIATLVQSQMFLHYKTGDQMNCNTGAAFIFNETRTPLMAFELQAQVTDGGRNSADFVETSEAEFREECMLQCLKYDMCGKMQNIFLVMNVPRRECFFFQLCTNIWGGRRPDNIESGVEFWKHIIDPINQKSWECAASTECASAEYTNCCQNTYDSVPVCAAVDSDHCSMNKCISGEHFCEKLDGNTKCIPDSFDCPKDSMNFLYPLIIIMIIILLGIAECAYGQYVSTTEEKKIQRLRDPNVQSLYFVKYDRSKFLTEGVEFPDESPPPLYFEYEAESCLKILLGKGTLKTSLAESIIPALQFAFVCLICSWMRTYCRHVDSGDNFDEDSLLGTLDSMAYVTSLLETYVAFLLVFILCNQLSWFFGVLGRMYELQGSISALGMLLSQVCDSEEDRFKAYRWLNLAHLFLHMATTEYISECVSYENLIECGLLLESELEVIKTTDDKLELMLKWLGRFTKNASPAGKKVYQEVRSDFNLALCVFRETMPYSLMQLMMLLTYFYLFLLPFSMYASMSSAHDSNTFNIIYTSPCLATFLVSAFYLGILNAIINLANPTGHDVDDINPESLLIETDHALVMHLGIAHDVNQGGEVVKVAVFDIESKKPGKSSVNKRRLLK